MNYDKRVAYHEAGHCVIALNLGLDVRIAQVTSEPRVSYRLADSDAWEWIDERVMFYMASFLAEANYSPTEVNVQHSMYDFGKALSLVAGYE